MRDYIIGTAKFFSILALAPISVGFIDAWSPGLGLLLLLLGVPIAFAILVIGGILRTVTGVKLSRQTADVRTRVGLALIAPLGIVLTCLISWPLLAAGNFTGNLSRLASNHRQYEVIIAKARASRTSAWFAVDHGVTYSVDVGPPVRVAFNPAGMLDNWSGIIFDPTGDVMLADGFDPRTGKFRAPDGVTKLFDGDLVSCRHLWRDYYDCSFT